MNRTSTVRSAALALALVSIVASIGAAQYRTTTTLARAGTTTHDTSTIARDSNAIAPAFKQPSVRGPSTF